MEKKSAKTDKGTKIFNAVFSLLLVVLLIVMLIYVAASPDFVPPGSENQGGSGGVTVDDNVWNYNMDDMLDYMEEKGFIKKENKLLLSTVGTENWLIDGIEIFWWDVENLVEGTEPYSYWNELQENDNLYIMFGGTVFAFSAVNGPFALYVRVAECPFSTEEVVEAFNAFPAAWSGAVSSAPSVWDYNMDDLLAYLDEKGYIDKNKKDLMSTVGTENWICNGIDIIWWDVENLEEGTEPYSYWNELQENDNLYVLYGTIVYTLTVNGPFAIHANANFPGDVNKLTEDFMAFPAGYSGAK